MEQTLEKRHTAELNQLREQMARIFSEQGAEKVEGNRSISEQPNESLIDELQEQCDEQQKVIDDLSGKLQQAVLQSIQLQAKCEFLSEVESDLKLSQIKIAEVEQINKQLTQQIACKS